MFMPSFTFALTFFSRRNPQERIRPAEVLKNLLKEAGYYVFEVSPEMVFRFDNMIAIHPDDVKSAVWIYRRQKNEFVIRPFEEGSAYEQLSESLLGKKTDDIVLIPSRKVYPHEEKQPWWNWLPSHLQEGGKQIGST